MLRRSPLRSKLPARPAARQWDGDRLPAPREPRPVAAVANATLVAPIPKGTAARPGKRAPTAEERRWLDAIVAYGCIACRIDGKGIVAPAVHHILRGGVRMGHLFSLPLCEPGHHQQGAPVMVSRHPWKAQFEQRYGTEESLLVQLQRALGWPEVRP